MNISENNLKLTGKVNIPDKLPISNVFKITVEGAITEVSYKDNEDGSVIRDHKFVPTLVEYIDDKGKIAHSKDKKTLSKRIRDRQWIWQQENQSDIDYERFGQLLLAHFGSVMDYLIELDKQ